MDYETSPTIRYDGTGEASNEVDNHSDKTEGTASEGSEGFVKVEEVMEDTSESHATPASSNTPAASSATPEEEKKPAEIELLQGLDPRDEPSDKQLQDYYHQLPTQTAPFAADSSSPEEDELRSSLYREEAPPAASVPSGAFTSEGEESFVPQSDTPLIDVPVPSYSGWPAFVGESHDAIEEPNPIGECSDVTEEPSEETQPPDAVPTEGGSVADKPQEAPEPVESDDKAPLTAEEPRPSMLETFNVSSLLSCSVGGETDEASSADECEDPVLDLLYWKDIKASAVTFGLSLLVLLSLCCCSIISVFSYLILSLLTVTISFRLYKFVIQTLNGTQQPNPFQSLLDADMTLSAEQVHKYTDALLSRLNGLIVTTRDLVLVKSLGASLKFGVLTWLMTYVGACFNGLTLLIIADVLAFLMPPVYQKYQQPIDTYYELVTSKINHVVTMVRSYIPGAKPKSE